MAKHTILINIIILFYILQRISEMFVSKSNEEWLKEHYAVSEVNPRESVLMKLFHTMWFLSLIIEANIKNKLQPQFVSAFIYLILGGCLVVRFYTMEKLKQFWTIKILSISNQKIISDGLYRYIRHPNYLVVIIEFILIPFLLNAYITLIMFSILNAFILYRRIKLEEKVMSKNSNYNELFKNVRRLIPYVLTLLLIFNAPLKAEEVHYQFNNYDEAKKSDNYVMFESASTKLGFITTIFNGYAKKIKINYDLKDKKISHLETTIEAQDLDTDNSSRNNKMFNTTLEIEKYPVIKVVINETVSLTEGEHVAEMQFFIKDKQVSKQVHFLVEEKNGKYLIHGSTLLSLKELGLPDPSIVIATVRDILDLKFSITLH